MKKNIKEYILCAAIYYDDGEVREGLPKNIETGLVSCGRRHHNCFTTLNATFSFSTFGHSGNRKSTQGFLTNTDRFVSREEAAKIAYEAKQIDKETSLLFSEDLY